MKKQTQATYPAPSAELATAIAATEAVDAKLVVIETAVRELPGKLVHAAAVVAEAEQKLAAKEVETLLPGADGIESEIATLEDDVERARATVVRLQRQSEALDSTGENLNAEMQATQSALNLELNIFVDEARDVLANRIVDKAQELGELYAAYGAFSRAAGIRSDWLQLAHVSDPRHAIQITTPGRTFDAAPNLFSQPKHNDSAEVRAIRSALEPMAKARALLKKREYTPRSQRIKPSNGPRGSSHGPNGVPDAPVSRSTGWVR
ncbi:Skp family chaperone for outer membrane proteins [Paraburkholderia tropica]|uniref:hypothetical protein n=1 Tax=Paraburkholderia tropica TaxID=92647 RepID=UPI00161E32E4|nr:hypothetical protein [Paraburkholderia tropica]MBB2999784.1 Skp family chaperone for outer membrane proteins [Paraburkholderia tropica]